MKRLYLRTWQSLKLRQLIVRLRKENSQIIIWEVSIGERWDKVGEKENKSDFKSLLFETEKLYPGSISCS